MKLYDVSLPISPRLPVWPGDPPFEIVRVAALERGDSVNVSQISVGSHLGTHIDAPLHLFANTPAVTDLPLDLLIGEAWVAHLPEDASVITAELLEAAAIPPGTTRLLLRTRNSGLWGEEEKRFREDFVAPDGGAAEWVVGRGIWLLGVDYLSVDRYGTPDMPAHRALLRNGIPVIEGLDLRAVAEGHYTLYCLPMKLEGADGAPARVVLAGE